MIKLKRAYEAASKDDGLRILVERLWPRGVSKQRARIDLWLKTLAPSTELRQWYGHDPARWPQFRKRYQAEHQGRRTSPRMRPTGRRPCDGAGQNCGSMKFISAGMYICPESAPGT